MTEVKKIEFRKEVLDKVEEIISRYPEGKRKSALLPVLHMAQAEFGGWLSADVMAYVAGLLKLKPIEVFEVATFYSMFRLEPVGKFVFEVCRTAPCCLNGAEHIIEHISNKLGIKDGETTSDGLFTLKTVECLAHCGHGPVMTAGWKYYEDLTVEKIDELIENCIKENKTTHINPYTDL